MKRRSFFKILAGAIGASVVAPHVLAEEVEPHVVVVKESIGFEGEQPIESVTTQTIGTGMDYNDELRKKFWIEWTKQKYHETTI